MTLLTSREADPQIIDAIRTGGVVSDVVARTIASWYHSPSTVDEQVTRVSHGQEFDAKELVSRMDTLISSVEFEESDNLPDLHALREWALSGLPHIVVDTFEIPADEWEAWVAEYNGESPSPETLPHSAEELIVADWQDGNGEWVYPGDDKFPVAALPKSELWIPASVVDTAVMLLTGTGSEFWAGSCGGDPFDNDPYWWQADGPAEPGAVFTSKYTNPYTGEVEIKRARLVGFTPEQETAIHGDAGLAGMTRVNIPKGSI